MGRSHFIVRHGEVVIHVADDAGLSHVLALLLKGRDDRAAQHSGHCVAQLAEFSGALLDASSARLPHARLRGLRDVAFHCALLDESDVQLVKDINVAYSLLRHRGLSDLQGNADRICASIGTCPMPESLGKGVADDRSCTLMAERFRLDVDDSELEGNSDEHAFEQDGDEGVSSILEAGSTASSTRTAATRTMPDPDDTAGLSCAGPKVCAMSCSGPTALEPCTASDGDEGLEYLPLPDKQADPYFRQKIKLMVGGKSFMGQVEDIDVGKESRERLYRIRYEDGDLQHMTLHKIQGCTVPG